MAGYLPGKYDRNLIDVMIEGMAEVVGEENVQYMTDPWDTGCTDMGDIATVIPAVHGYSMGGAGTSHGIDYRISDPEKAYIESSILNASIAVDLLFGDAEKGKAIAARKRDLLPIPEYIRVIDNLSKTVSSADLGCYYL